MTATCHPPATRPAMEYRNFDLRIDTPDAVGYIFVHCYLMDHFAAMEGEASADRRPQTADG